jgi:hypothetical protein
MTEDSDSAPRGGPASELTAVTMGVPVLGRLSPVPLRVPPPHEACGGGIEAKATVRRLR